MWGEYASRDPKELERLPFVSGHFGYDFARHFMEGRYCFTFLRDPVERLLSLYSYCRHEKAEYEINRLAQESDPEEFFHSGCTADSPYASHMWNHQAVQLAFGWGASLVGDRDIGMTELSEDEILDRAIRNLETLNYVGLVEEFATDNEAVFAALGDTSKWSGHKVNVAPNRIARDQLSGTTASLLHSMTEIDRALYRHAVARRKAMRSLDLAVGH